MGDLRAGYRFLAPALRAAGYRVACTDLRGHGDSDATFTSYGDEETAGDVIALLEELGGPAVVVGNSMGAGAAALAAAERPELVSGLVLAGPFVRNPKTSAMRRLLLRVAMAPPWAAISWKSYLPKLYAVRGPPISASTATRLSRVSAWPGYAKAVLPDHPHQPRPGGGAAGRGHGARPGRDGRARPRLSRPAGGGRLDRPRPARASRHGARRRALPAVAAARHHHRRVLSFLELVNGPAQAGLIRPGMSAGGRADRRRGKPSRGDRK